MTAPEPELVRIFPDIPTAVVDLLEQHLATNPDQVGTHTPPDLQQRLPFVRVLRAGGPDDGLSDRATIDVEVFAATYGAAWQLAERIRSYLTARWHTTPDGVVLDRAVTEVGPRELPWGDEQNVRRFGATYTITARRIDVVATP